MIVGLGNPGKRYERTRHNVGFMVLDKMAQEEQARFKRWWLTGAWGTRIRTPQEMLLIKPQRYMNRSGEPVAAVLRKERMKPEDLLVVADDVHLPLGRLRFRAGGSAGGHNGLRSVIARLGTSEFARLRVGVGPAPEGWDMINFVLGTFGRHEPIEEMVGRAAEAVQVYVDEGLEWAMNKFNAG